MKIFEPAHQAVFGAVVERRTVFWTSRRALWLSLGALFLLSLPLFFFRLGAWAFFDPDEGRYGEIPRAMLERGDFITPTLNGVGFFDKPPLLYWGIALFYRVLGVSEGAARLVPALAALAAVYGAWALGRRMFGPRAGFLSGAILATCIVWPAMARVVLTDMLVSSLVFLAMAFWWMSRTEINDKTRTCYNFGFWTALALGVLAKGPVAVVLVAGTVIFYTLLSGDRSGLRSLGWKMGLVWFLLLTAPWFVMVQMRNPDFNHAFWIEQHFGRFLGLLAEKDHDQGPAYFFVLIPVIFFPWTFFAPAAIVAGWKKIWPGRGQVRSEKGRAALFLCCGVAFVTLFFTGSSSKLVTYILPVLPLMAIALAGYFDSFFQKESFRWTRSFKASAFALSIGVVALGVAACFIAPHALAKAGAPVLSAYLLSGALVLWGTAVGFNTWKQRFRGAIAATTLGFCLMFVVAIQLVSVIAEQTTSRQLVEDITPGLRQNALLVSQGFTQSLTFYTGRRIAMVFEPDELRASLAHLAPEERRRWFLKDADDLRRVATTKTPVYFVARTSHALRFQKQLNELGGDIRPLFANDRFMFMGNRAASLLTPAHLDEGELARHLGIKGSRRAKEPIASTRRDWWKTLCRTLKSPARLATTVLARFANTAT